jgi:hypothetical protein
MTPTLMRPRRLAGLLVTAAVLLVTPVLGAAQTAPVPVERQAAAPAPHLDQDANEIREQFEALLKRLPPSVGQVLRLDPSLMSLDSYLQVYPSLATFLKQHPEVRSNPGFYLQRVQSELWNPRTPVTRESEAIRIWRDLLSGAALLAVIAGVAYVITWVIRTAIDYRRWNRVSKVQTDVHTKLLDRLTSNDDLMAYMQTPAGRRFLESAPLAIDSTTKPIGAPLSRILTSMQIGIVLAVGSLGLLFVGNWVVEEIAQPLFAIGVLALAVGAGFMASAAASLLLTRRLGLMDPPAAPREHNEAASH